MSLLRRVVLTAPTSCRLLQSANVSAAAPLQKLKAKIAPTNVDEAKASFFVAPEKRNPQYWDYMDRESDCALADQWPAKPSEWHKTSVVQDGEQPKGPQAAYPEFKYHLPYDTSKYRLYMIPESFFNFMYDRTGVLGPYMLLWGSALTVFSKEYFIFNGESFAFFTYLACVPYIASKVGPAIDRAYRARYDESCRMVEKMKRCKAQEFTNEADALEEDKTRNEAGKALFDVYAANAENAIEAEFRSRQEQVYQAFKRRADYQLAVQSLEENLVQRQLVAWVKSEVANAITSRGDKEGVRQCIQDLKDLAARTKTAAV